jgi:hypothetical protein
MTPNHTNVIQSVAQAASQKSFFLSHSIQESERNLDVQLDASVSFACSVALAFGVARHCCIQQLLSFSERNLGCIIVC